MSTEPKLHVLADRWRTLAAALRDLDQQAVARRIHYDVDLYEALADEVDLVNVQIAEYLSDSLMDQLRDGLAAMKLLSDLQEEYPLQTKDECDDCLFCGTHVMCAQHSFISALHRQTWTTGAIERDLQRTTIQNLRTQVSLLQDEVSDLNEYLH